MLLNFALCGDNGGEIETVKTLFSGKFKCIPPTNRNASFDTYYRLVEHEVELLFKHKIQFKMLIILLNWEKT